MVIGQIGAKVASIKVMYQITREPLVLGTINVLPTNKNRYPLSIHDMNLSISIKSIQIQVMHKHIFLVLSTQTYGMLDRKKQ